MIYLILGLSLSAFATFIPEDQIKVYPPASSISQVSEAEFNFRAEKIRQVYTPIMKDLGGKFKLNADWKKNKLNARATQFFGNWIVEFTGGIARHPDLTPDAMSLIICHEIGHHMGGFPFTGSIPFINWAAVEGQADYYSTHMCARKLWSEEREINETFAASATLPIRENCDRLFQDQNDKNLCYRIGMGSLSVAKTMASIMGKPIPQIETPDPTIQSRTISSHPSLQCRLDTLYQGSICVLPPNHKIIPGKRFLRKRSLEAEKESAGYTCTALSGFQEGLRPNCWFKARM